MYSPTVILSPLWWADVIEVVCFFPQMHMYSLGMTLFWGADYEIPQSQVNYFHAFFGMAEPKYFKCFLISFKP